MNKKLTNTSIIGAIIFISSIRGIFELLFEKDIAHVLQALLIIILISLIKTSKNNYFQKPMLVLGVIFLIICISSITLTYISRGIVGYNIIFIILFTLYFKQKTTQIDINQVDVNFLYFIISCIFYLLIFVSFLQQVDYFYAQYFPGRTDGYEIVRPQSLTGSYLHYPIILSIMTILFLERFIRYFNYYSFLSLIGFIACLYSQSRYAILSIITYITLKLIKIILIDKKIPLVLIIGIGLIICLFLTDTIILNRVLSIFNLQGPGNEQRIISWTYSVYMLDWTSVFYSNDFGIYSNSFRSIYNREIIVPESSLLYLILNFGLIGSMIYFYLISFTIFQTRKYIALVSILTPSLFYQSIEVLPFIVLYCLLSIILNNKSIKS